MGQVGFINWFAGDLWIGPSLEWWGGETVDFDWSNLPSAWMDLRMCVWAEQFSRVHWTKVVLNNLGLNPSGSSMCSGIFFTPSRYQQVAVRVSWAYKKGCKTWGSYQHCHSLCLSLSLSISVFLSLCRLNMQICNERKKNYVMAWLQGARAHDDSNDHSKARYLREVERTSTRLNRESLCNFLKEKSWRLALGSLLYPQSQHCDCVGHSSSWWSLEGGKENLHRWLSMLQNLQHDLCFPVVCNHNSGMPRSSDSASTSASGSIASGQLPALLLQSIPQNYSQLVEQSDFDVWMAHNLVQQTVWTRRHI